MRILGIRAARDSRCKWREMTEGVSGQGVEVVGPPGLEPGTKGN
jgi:hypothetical protein